MHNWDPLVSWDFFFFFEIMSPYSSSEAAAQVNGGSIQEGREGGRETALRGLQSYQRGTPEP